MDIDIEKETINSACVVRINQEIDTSNASQLKEYLKNIVDNENNKIILGLSGVQYIDSSALGVFISLAMIIKNKGGFLKLYGLSEGVKQVLLLTKLTSFFDIYQDEQSSLKSIH